MCVSIFLPAAPGRRRGPRSSPSDEAAGRPRRGPNGRASRLPARRRSSSRPRVLPAALPALPARRARRSHPGRAPPRPGPRWAQPRRARPAPPRAPRRRRRAPGRILRRRAGRAARSGWAPGGCGRLCPRPLFKAASGPPALGRPGGGTSGRRALSPRVRARGSAGRHGARARSRPGASGGRAGGVRAGPAALRASAPPPPALPRARAMVRACAPELPALPWKPSAGPPRVNPVRAVGVPTGSGRVAAAASRSRRPRPAHVWVARRRRARGLSVRLHPDSQLPLSSRRPSSQTTARRPPRSPPSLQSLRPRSASVRPPHRSSLVGGFPRCLSPQTCALNWKETQLYPPVP